MVQLKYKLAFKMSIYFKKKDLFTAIETLHLSSLDS